MKLSLKARLLSILCFSVFAHADVIHVTPGELIEDALFASAAGDTIILDEGVYTESVFIQARRITIGSQYLLDGDSSHVSRTVITPDAASPDTQSCFIIVGCPDMVRIAGLTMRDGRGTFWSQQSMSAGGCVYSLRSRTVIEKCEIYGASAVYGGGIFSYRRELEPISSLMVENCRIHDCVSDAWGGGIYANYCSLQVRGTQIRNCSSLSQSGGGITALSSSSLVEECSFDSCSGVVGGAEFGSGNAVIRNCRFVNNTATLTQYSAHLTLGQGKHRGEGNYFGPTMSNTVGVRFCCDTGDSVYFIGNVLELNEATVRSGSLYSAGVAGEISYNIFRQNVGVYGGQIYCFQGTTVDIHHNVFEVNISLDPEFPSILLTGPNAHQQFHHNSLIGNSGQTVNFLSETPAIIDARNNWWGHESGPYHPTLNPAGQGDTLLSDSVLFDPWLLSPPDTTNSVSPRPETPVNWKLVNVYPNPFNSQLSISLAGIMGNEFTLKLYDLLGREIAVLRQGRGYGGVVNYSAPISLASGVYFLQAAEGTFSDIRKVVFLK